MTLEKMSDFFDARADTYDSHMLDDLGLDEFYQAVSVCFEKPIKRLLDLGCGTGLELARLFERFPEMNVTGIDMSAEMLRKLETKYPDKGVKLICGSYFDEDFQGTYDAVLSTYSLHHFSEAKKLTLYEKICSAIETKGIFVFGDYTVPSAKQQQELLSANEAKRREQGIPDCEFYHFDTPFTPFAEIRLMKEAGFAAAKIAAQWENSSVIIAKR